MKSSNRAQEFDRLHVKGDPLVLFNVWDPGSARAVVEAGAKALATGSWSVAAAYGFSDEEQLPLNLALENAQRIIAAVKLPVSIDFESGYAAQPAKVNENARRLIQTGAVGCNFEDQVIGAEGLYSIDEQCARIKAVRRAADDEGVAFFINARTDIFLKADAKTHNSQHLAEAKQRAEAYSAAGASGFFAPGLMRPDFSRELCQATQLPVNIMMFPGVPSRQELAALGVARISYGPGPYRQTMAVLTAAAKEALG